MFPAQCGADSAESSVTETHTHTHSEAHTMAAYQPTAGSTCVRQDDELNLLRFPQHTQAGHTPTFIQGHVILPYIALMSQRWTSHGGFGAPGPQSGASAVTHT